MKRSESWIGGVARKHGANKHPLSLWRANKFYVARVAVRSLPWHRQLVTPSRRSAYGVVRIHNSGIPMCGFSATSRRFQSQGLLSVQLPPEENQFSLYVSALFILRVNTLILFNSEIDFVKIIFRRALKRANVIEQIAARRTKPRRFRSVKWSFVR